MKGLEYDAVNSGFFVGAAGRRHGPIVITALRTERSQGAQQGACCGNARTMTALAGIREERDSRDVWKSKSAGLSERLGVSMRCRGH